MTLTSWIRVVGTQLVYVGPALGVRPHSTAVSRLLVGVDGKLEVRTPGSASGTAWGTGPVRSAYVAARVAQQVRARGRWAVVYLAPASDREHAVRAAMLQHRTRFRTGHQQERLLADLFARPTAADDVTDVLDRIGPDGRSRARPEVAAVLEWMEQPQGPGLTSHSADEAAAVAGWSRAHFLREFSAATGTSFRRYRMWLRFLAATRRWQDGASFTEAASDAGFASPSHLSDAARATFGFTPTELGATGARWR